MEGGIKMANKYPRHKNIRYPGYDYASPGAYLVTICTRERIHYLAVERNKQFVEQTWNDLPQRFPSIRLDAFAVLPNHIHGILWLAPTETDHPTLGRIIRAYKSLVYCAYRQSLRENNPRANTITLWQPGYHDRIIRVDKHLEQARLYILNNYEKHLLKGDFPS